MPQDTMPTPTALAAAAHETLVANLRNAHALEKQAITVLEAQLKLLTDFPDFHARVSEHIVESREQARRLEGALEACGASTSMIKDALLSVMGMGQSSVQGFSEDAVLKAMVADILTEHVEIATYRTLIVLADLAGKSELRPRLEESLREEQAMAEWLDENLEPITRRYVDLKAPKPKEDAVADEDTANQNGEPPQTLWQTLEAARAPNNQSPRAEPSTGMTQDNPNAADAPDAPRFVEPEGPEPGVVRPGR